MFYTKVKRRLDPLTHNSVAKDSGWAFVDFADFFKAVAGDGDAIDYFHVPDF
jgi:hypothetical protein